MVVSPSCPNQWHSNFFLSSKPLATTYVQSCINNIFTCQWSPTVAQALRHSIIVSSAPLHVTSILYARVKVHSHVSHTPLSEHFTLTHGFPWTPWGLMWSLHWVYMDSMRTPWILEGVHGCISYSLHRVHMESRETLWNIVDSMGSPQWTPWKLLVDSP